MYKRKQKQAPSYLSLSSKSLKTDRTSKPPSLCAAVIEENNENDSGNAADIFEDQDDDFVIPASQQAETTTQRRYFSQRSNANRSQAGATAGAAGSSVRRVPTTFFENTLLRCGVIFDNAQYIVLGCDHINFVNKLRTMLQSAPDHPENVTRFVSGLKEYMSDEQQLTKVLTVCMINVPSCDFLPQSQDSLMRVFLIIEFLEQKIVELLLDTLGNICSTSNPTDQNICCALLILGQLGFVNKKINSEQIYSQIVALLGLTEDIFRNEIIKFLPDILDVKKHDSIVEKIISLMGSDPHKYLNEVTVNSFEALQLTPRLRSLLKTRILTYIQEENAPIELYPVFTKFLLNCNSSENYLELVTRYRKIDWDRVGQTEERRSVVHETQKAVFEFILCALKRSKELTDGWLKSILNAGRVEDCFPSDVIVLIIMSSINEDKSLYLESVLRRKIKSGWITRETFSKGITGFPLVISQHLKVFFEFIDNMFRMKDDLFEFGEIGYKLAFGIPKCDHKLLLSKLIAFVCEKNSDYIVRRALILLQEICNDYPDEVQRNSLQILRLLDKVDDVGLFEYRLIMDLLSSIAYPPPPALPVDGVASHIDIMVRKQVTGSGNNIRRQGIVGSVRVIDHLVWHADASSAAEGEVDDSESTIFAIEDLPEGNAKNAANIINLMLLSSENHPYNRALCYDELSSALCPGLRNTKQLKFLNRPFLNWLSEMMTSEFQNIFVVTELPVVNAGITLDKMFKLNRDEEYTETNTEIIGIAVNIAGLVFAEDYKTLPVVTTLAPTFNIVRILSFHLQNGNLEGINALLGCPIIFPQFINSPEDLEFDDPVKNVLIMDIFFQTANWFREIICAFSSQRELKIRMKVLQRLAELISLEQNIRNLLPTMPATYMPPKCYFMTTERNEMETGKKAPKTAPQSGEKGKEKEKDKSKPVDSIPNNSTLLSGDQTLLQSSRAEAVGGGRKAVSSSGFYGPKEVYRQLDPDILLLLNEALCTSYPLPRDKMGTCLGLAEYKFIVEDLILKLESVTGLKKGIGFQQEQYVFSAVSLISDLVTFLERFMHFFDQIASAIKGNQAMGEDESTDKNLYTDEMNILKRCFGLTLRLLAALFSWQGFHQEKHQMLFKSSLLIVLRDSQEKDAVEQQEPVVLCNRVINSMIARTDLVLDLYSAVHMNNLVVALSGYTNDYAKAVTLCENFLKIQWHSHTGAVERGGDANSLLNELLKVLYKNVDFKTLRKRIDKTVRELDGLKGKEGKLKSLPNFNKANFPILFRALANSIYELTVERLEKDLTTLMKLEFWEQVYDSQNSLLDIIQQVNVPRNFTIFLKYSQLILKLFLHGGMPVVESSLKTHTDRVKDLLKSVQHTTRFLHKLCCQSKSVKNSSVIALIPSLRQSVESFNYSVKAALVANKCSVSFLLNHLKNSDLQGEAILSQVVSLADVPAVEDDDSLSEPETEMATSYLGITTMCHNKTRTPAAAVAGPSSGRRTTRSRK